MNKIKAEYFKNKLENKEKELKDTIGKIKVTLDNVEEKYNSSELSSYDNHLAEAASDMVQKEYDTALTVHEQFILSEITDAIHRIDTNTYGICTFCGNMIKEIRLEVLPYARLCLNCEKSRNVGALLKSGSRPNEERVMDLPLTDKFRNSNFSYEIEEDDKYLEENSVIGENENEFDGLDELNNLMEFGSSDSPQDFGGYDSYDEYFKELDKEGIVDPMDAISNETYKRQLPD